MTGYIDFSNLNTQLQNLINASSSGGIKSINGVFADAQGNVEIPIHKTNPIKLDVSGADAEYKDGFGIYSIDYKKADYTDYLVDNESYEALEDSKLVIFTFKDTTTGTYYQEIKSIVDEKVKALYYRVGDNLGTWQELVEITGEQADIGDVVRKINDFTTEQDGKVTIPNASNSVAGLVKIDNDTIKIDANGVISSSGGEYVGELPERTDYSYIPPADSQMHNIATVIVPSFNEATDILIPLKDGNPIDSSDYTYSYNETTEELTFILTNDASVSSGYPFGLIRYKQKFTPRTDATVVDVLTSNSVTDALSANQGRLLKNELDAHKSDVSIHMSANEKTKLRDIAEGATKTVPDGSTIKIDANGVISTTVDINEAVLTINGFAPDVDGNIDISYKEIIGVRLDVPITDSEYIEGTTIQYMNYNPDDYDAYIQVYHSLDIVPQSKLSITTSKDSVNKIYYQHMVAIVGDSVYGSYIRTANELGEWQPIVKVYNGGQYDPTSGLVLKVNGQLPNADGEVTIPHATATTEGLVKVAQDLTSHAETDAVSAKVVESVNNDLQNHKLSPDHLQGGERDTWNAKANKTIVTTTVDGLMSKEDKVKIDGIAEGATKIIIDDDTIKVNNDGKIFVANGGGGSATVNVIDNLEGTSSTDALSSNQGRVLKGLIDSKASKDVATQSTDGLLSSADKTKLDNVVAGATKIIPDNNTIKIDNSTGIIHAYVVDSYQSPATDVPLSARMGKYIYDKIQAHEDTHNIHTTLLEKEKLSGIESGANKTTIVNSLTSEDVTAALSANNGKMLDEKITTHDTKKATATELGHVKVDNSTIKVDADGMISVDKDAVSGLHLTKDSFQLTVTSANQNEFDMPSIYNLNPNGFVTMLFYNTLMVYETEYEIVEVSGAYKLRLLNNAVNSVDDIYNLVLIGGGSKEVVENLSLGSSGISATNDIRPSHAPSYYHEGITRGLMVGGDTDKTEWVQFINSTMGWDYENLSYDIDIEVLKTDSSALQTIKVFNASDTESHSVNYEYLIVRESVDLATWSELSTNPQIRYGKGNPNGIEFGLDGAIYFDSTNGLIYEMVNDDHTQVHNTGWEILSKPVNYRFEVVTQRVHLEDGEDTATYDFGAEYHDDYEWSAYDSGLRLFEDDGYFTEQDTTVSFTFHDGGAHYDTKITFVGERAVPILD